MVVGFDFILMSALTFRTRVMSVVCYSSFVDNKQSQIKRKLESIFEKYNVSKSFQESIKEMMKALSKKTFTPDDKAW